VTTRSCLPAKIEVIREFIYPTEYDPPELPNSVGGGGGDFNNDNGDGGGNNGTFPVTPANPAAFDMKPVGSVLEGEPVVSSDAKIVEVNLEAVHREFVGFVNYGTPITSFVGNDPRNRVVITANRILQPVFETRRIKNSTSVYDGQTILIGGMLTDEAQIVEDKVPLLGDVPLIGRFFKSNVNEQSRRVLLIFLTVRTLDPSGRPVSETYQAVGTNE
jgi:general secretion pathway protein D